MNKNDRIKFLEKTISALVERMSLESTLYENVDKEMLHLWQEADREALRLFLRELCFLKR